MGGVNKNENKNGVRSITGWVLGKFWDYFDQISTKIYTNYSYANYTESNYVEGTVLM